MCTNTKTTHVEGHSDTNQSLITLVVVTNLITLTKTKYVSSNFHNVLANYVST